VSYHVASVFEGNDRNNEFMIHSTSRSSSSGKKKNNIVNITTLILEYGFRSIHWSDGDKDHIPRLWSHTGVPWVMIQAPGGICCIDSPVIKDDHEGEDVHQLIKTYPYSFYDVHLCLGVNVVVVAQFKKTNSIDQFTLFHDMFNCCQNVRGQDTTLRKRYLIKFLVDNNNENDDSNFLEIGFGPKYQWQRQQHTKKNTGSGLIENYNKLLLILGHGFHPKQGIQFSFLPDHPDQLIIINQQPDLQRCYSVVLCSLHPKISNPDQHRLKMLEPLRSEVSSSTLTMDPKLVNASNYGKEKLIVTCGYSFQAFFVPLTKMCVVVKLLADAHAIYDRFEFEIPKILWLTTWLDFFVLQASPSSSSSSERKNKGEFMFLFRFVSLESNLVFILQF